MAKKKRRGHGEGTVFLRKDGRWQASFIDSNGKRRYFYGLKQSEALERMRRAQEEDKQGILASGPNQLLGVYITEWLEHVHKPTIRIASYLTYRSMIKNHILPALGQLTLRQLTPQQVQAFYSTLLNEKKLAPQTVSLIHAILHSALENAVRWNLVPRNVTALVSSPQTEQYEPVVISPDEAKRLLDLARGNRMYAIVLLAVTTAARRGEILSLRWSDIDLKQGVIFIHRTMNRYSGYGFVENDAKTRAGRRKVVLPAVVLQALLEHKAMQEDARQKASAKWKERNLVFCTSTGNYIQPAYVWERFRKLLAKAGLPDMRFHDLRHSAATILLTMGVHPKVVQELLGHSSIAITMNVYSHLLPSMQGDAMGMINDVFKDDEEEEKEEN